MPTKTAIEIANDIRRVEYAIAEIEQDITKADIFMNSAELLKFWDIVNDLEIQRLLVEGKFDGLSSTKFQDLQTDIK